MGVAYNQYTNAPTKQEDPIIQTPKHLQQSKTPPITHFKKKQQKVQQSSEQSEEEQPSEKPQQAQKEQSPRAQQAKQQQHPQKIEQQFCPQKSPKAYSQLVINTMPIQQVKLVKQCQRKRTQIFWLKEHADSQKQNTRDSILREQGYMLYSTNHLPTLLQKQKQKSSSNFLRLSTVVLFSYSQHYNSQQIIKSLYQFFVKQGRIGKLLIVRPTELKHYNMEFNQISSNQSISELAYPIEYIRHKIAEHQINSPIHSVHFLPLNYWAGREGLSQIYKQKDGFQVYLTKCKVAIEGCLKVGNKIIEQLQQKDSCKHLLKSYAQFHDLYMNDSVKQIGKDKSYLQRIGMKMLQDPINFYLNPTHNIIINRVLSYCGDHPQYLNGIALPLNLLVNKIKEDYYHGQLVRKYRDQFISYFHTILSDQTLHIMVKDSVFENMGFIKATLKINDPTQNPSNTLFIIHVNPLQRDVDSDRGYCFIGNKPKDIDQQDDEQSPTIFFQGYSYVLFNLFNSFRVISHHLDNKINKHIIEAEYGFICAQISKKKMVNFIGEEQVRPRYIEKQHKQRIDYEAIIRYQSNRELIDKIEDYGDGYSLLQRYSEAVAYYDRLFAKCKTEMKEDLIILSNLQNKKAINLQLGKSSQHALEYFYNAYNFIRKIKSFSDTEINIMKCLQKEKQYQKVISFGGSLLDIAQRYKIINSVPKQFLLGLYSMMARAYEMKYIVDLQLKTHTKEIMKCYQQGLRVVEEIGEYSENVPSFYLQLAKHYLIIRQPFQALVYLNKSLLINMTIFTEHHPKLCPYYQMLAVAYVSMHDYSQALKAITTAETIFGKYYEKDNSRFLSVYEIKGKIYGLTDSLREAMLCFKRQQQIISRYISDRRHRNASQRKYSLNSISVGLYNLVESKQFMSYFDSFCRKDKQEICMVYVLLYQAHLYRMQYDYPSAVDLLERAHKLNAEQQGEKHTLNFQILILTCQVLVEHLEYKKAGDVLKQTFNLFIKGKNNNDKELTKYYGQLADIGQQEGNFTVCMNSLVKIKEIHFRKYGKNSLQNCKIGSKIGRMHLRMNNPHDCRLYVQECESVLQRLALKTNNGQSTLVGKEMEGLLFEIEMERCECLFKRGWIQELSAKCDDAISIYRKAIQRYEELVGEYHPSVANVHYRIGKCFFQKGSEHMNSVITQLSKALAIYTSSQKYRMQCRIEIYLTLSKAYQQKNQLSKAIDQLACAVNILVFTNKIGSQYLFILQQIARIMGIILAQPTLNYLKNVYFTIAKLFSEVRNQKEPLNKPKHEYKEQIDSQVAKILTSHGRIRQQIENIDNKQQRQQKDLMKKLQQKEHYITLQKIKENLSIRKQLRTRAK